MSPARFLGRARKAALPTWLCLGVALTASAASAAGWSIQTVALRDYRDAQATAADLRDFGLDAYTEFSMSNGVQYVRVRFGCFATREGAEELAVRLRDYLVADAVPVERTPQAPAHGCLEETTGFLKPSVWRQVEEGVPLFEVTVAGTTAIVRHTGQAWRMVQEGMEPPAYLPSPAPQFRQGVVLDIPVVETTVGAATVVVCPGRLLAEVGEVAIVERDDRVVSCRLLPPTALAEGG